MPHYMDHNEFQFDIDLVEPIKDFMKKIESSKQAMFNGNKSIQVLSTRPEQPKEGATSGREERKEAKKSKTTDVKHELGSYADELDKKRLESLKQADTKFKNFKDDLNSSQTVQTINTQVNENEAVSHYLVKPNSNLHMATHCSKVDESFTDYLLEAVNPASAKELYADFIGAIFTGKRVAKGKTADKDSTEYVRNFVLYFDQSFFEAPPIIKKLEKEMAQSEQEASK